MRPFVIARDVFLIGVIVLLIVAVKGLASWWWVAVFCGIYGAILALGATLIHWNFFIPAHHHGRRDSMLLALTFDDGPATNTEDILGILKNEGVPAAFFTIGKRAEAAPGAVLRWRDEGHLIGNHSYAHSFHFDWQGA